MKMKNITFCLSIVCFCLSVILSLALQYFKVYAVDPRYVVGILCMFGWVYHAITFTKINKQ